MLINELSRRVNLSDKTIRYYESIDLLPAPRRLPNGYRHYDESDVDRLRFIAGARQLNFSLDDIGEVLALRDDGQPPCRTVMDMLLEKASAVREQIEVLRNLERELIDLHHVAAGFPIEDIDGKNCVCHLVRDKVTPND